MFCAHISDPFKNTDPIVALSLVWTIACHTSLAFIDCSKLLTGSYKSLSSDYCLSLPKMEAIAIKLTASVYVFKIGGRFLESCNDK